MLIYTYSDGRQSLFAVVTGRISDAVAKVLGSEGFQVLLANATKDGHRYGVVTDDMVDRGIMLSLVCPD